MNSMPIRALTLYKHGLGSFLREADVAGEQVQLSFPRTAMNDVLKSLIADVPGEPGAVLSFNFESPPDRNEAMRRPRQSIQATHALVDLLCALRSRKVCLHVLDVQSNQPAGQTQLQHQAYGLSQKIGQIIGLELPKDADPTHQQLVFKPEAETAQLWIVPLAQIRSIDLIDREAINDMDHLLRSLQSSDTRETTVLQLKPSEHPRRLRIAYIAPAPAWRVSYRLLLNPLADHGTPSSAEQAITLQAFGVFDNTLDEDLDQVQLTLMAGMPVSFQYLLHEPNTPARAVVQDESRSVNAPIEFAAVNKRGAKLAKTAMVAGAVHMMADMDTHVADSFGDGMGDPHASSGESMGALFAYKVANKISVPRGNSAMVPLIHAALEGRRELLFNAQKRPKHPVASVRFLNRSGFTLERGPLTVFDQLVCLGKREHQTLHYAGEAVLAITAAEAEVIVAYAVELGVEIDVQTRHEYRRFAISIENGSLIQTDLHLCISEYRARSNSASNHLVTIEHNRQGNYQLLSGDPHPTPHTSDVHWVRYEVALSAFGRAELTVTERLQTRNQLGLEAFNAHDWQSAMAGADIDALTLRRLQLAFELRKQIEPINLALQQFEQQKQQLTQNQQRARDNLASLKDTGPEAKLRERFAGELATTEDQLQALQRQHQAALEKRHQLEQAALRALLAD